MTDKLRALEQKFRERARVARGLRDGSASPDADWHGGMALGGESVTVNLSSLRSLHERGIIEEAPKQSGDAFWLTRYRLKEPQS